MEIRDGDYVVRTGPGARQQALDHVSSRHREREKTKRLLIGAACFLFVVATFIIVFAPAGKEKYAYILGAVMIIISLGAIGAVKFHLKLPFVDIDTRDSKPSKK